jgi:Tol biopolymer transport system component
MTARRLAPLLALSLVLVFTMCAETSNPVALDNLEPSFRSGPSPFGSKIAFVTDRDGNSEVYVMNADGSGQTILTNNPAFDGRPSWGWGRCQVCR